MILSRRANTAVKCSEIWWGIYIDINKKRKRRSKNLHAGVKPGYVTTWTHLASLTAKSRKESAVFLWRRTWSKRLITSVWEVTRSASLALMSRRTGKFRSLARRKTPTSASLWQRKIKPSKSCRINSVRRNLSSDNGHKYSTRRSLRHRYREWERTPQKTWLPVLRSPWPRRTVSPRLTIYVSVRRMGVAVTNLL